MPEQPLREPWPISKLSPCISAENPGAQALSGNPASGKGPFRNEPQAFSFPVFPDRMTNGLLRDQSLNDLSWNLIRLVASPPGLWGPPGSFQRKNKQTFIFSFLDSSSSMNNRFRFQTLPSLQPEPYLISTETGGFR